MFTVNLLFFQGIDFKSLKFDEALAQAKAEDKLIFIDFYTEWCGPCKNLLRVHLKSLKTVSFTIKTSSI
uniref:thioredoxin domain-containing protein n=1 Tax=uncultured Tenacibaculum sp. TaxID=174713 RepID=UPI00343541D8